MNLADFLLARIAEDEADARMADRGVPWRSYERPSCSGIWGSVEPGGRGYRVATLPRALEADHIARWDPARVLAECDAKRRIVEHERAVNHGEKQMYDVTFSLDSSDVLRLLALPYAAHVDYREEWRP